jgi:2-iminobutanoate/2-iminopropanoate deaminase
MMRKSIFTEKGAKPIGPYSQAIVADGPLVFVSGQGPIDPKTGTFNKDDVAAQAKQVFENITTLLEAAGTSWANVVRVGVFLSDMKYFAAMNEVYSTYVSAPYPARTTVQAQLPIGIDVEVDCIAAVPQD